MGAIYAGFGLQKGNSSQIAAEVAAATGLFVGSLAALWVSAWVVPIAYIAHGIWDYAHHEGSKFASRSWKFVVVKTRMVSSLLCPLRLGGGGNFGGHLEPANLIDASRRDQSSQFCQQRGASFRIAEGR
jgi:hypothetical protein